MADTDKPKFEPPPWEQEAFERFRSEREAQQKEAALEAALRAVREREESPAEAQEAPADAGSTPAIAEVPSWKAEPAQAPHADPAPAGPSEAQIDSMLIELRTEEPPVAKTNMPLVNVVIGVFVVVGLYVIVQAALLFAGTQGTEAGGAGGMLGATASFVVLLAGVGFLAGAVLLFRKYHM